MRQVDKGGSASLAESDAKRPRVTFALFAYNHERHILQAIEGAFSQSYQPLEIILSDDCSDDSTFDIMQSAAKTYNGRHRIILNRNAKNLNIGDHVNVVAGLASGDLIVIAAGDDISTSDRTERLVERWLALGRPTAVLCSDFEAIDANSRTVELKHERLFRGKYCIQSMACGQIGVLGATAAVTRNIFSAFPPLESSVRHEDRVFPWRAMLLGGIVGLVDEKLVKYRVEGGISRHKVESARDFLYNFVPQSSLRLLPDALQRLADLESVQYRSEALTRECVATIADHRSSVLLTQARGAGLELALVQSLRKGARPLPLIKLYAKLRLLWLYEIFVAIKRIISG